MFTYQIDTEVSLALPRPKIDSQTLFEIIKENSQDLGAWLPWAPSIKTVDDEEQFLTSTLQNFGTSTSLNTVILYHGIPVGMISLNKFTESGHITDIGYWLGSQYVGNGIMHRAVTGICAIAFEDYQVHKVEIHAAIENTRSNNVAKNAGFHFDGSLRAKELLLDGFHDENCWSLLATEWAQKNNSRNEKTV
ncbi:GNAT family N-acetyltransferase [Ligilactobacillus sp. WILCCON 0076]|uniref:GNAT family N-acetyltransferase n=1 Tax=Ligilactobacillus ubinensis TaxID=2876789 RepID=A0A9X2FLW9_9LACO|nr:GNAT family protein [Ligilactobacillus ubinensis]MCP0887957.1 GNAT family N-acetyltransferase [Ligilactobacillus ubinensis]